MKTCKESQELKKFAAEAANSNPSDTRHNERIVSLFLNADFDPKDKIKNRIFQKLTRQNCAETKAYPFSYKILAATVPLGIAALVMLWHPIHKSTRYLRPANCYAYYNFPSTGAEAMLRINETPTDWLAYYRFPNRPRP